MPVIALVTGTTTANLAVPEVQVAETYRLEAEEEDCEAAHKMRDELELQLNVSRQQPPPPPRRQAARISLLATKPAVQRSRRT